GREDPSDETARAPQWLDPAPRDALALPVHGRPHRRSARGPVAAAGRGQRTAAWPSAHRFSDGPFSAPPDPRRLGHLAPPRHRRRDRPDHRARSGRELTSRVETLTPEATSTPVRGDETARPPCRVL